MQNDKERLVEQWTCYTCYMLCTFVVDGQRVHGACVCLCGGVTLCAIECLCVSDQIWYRELYCRGYELNNVRTVTQVQQCMDWPCGGSCPDQSYDLRVVAQCTPYRHQHSQHMPRHHPANYTRTQDDPRTRTARASQGHFLYVFGNVS